MTSIDSENNINIKLAEKKDESDWDDYVVNHKDSRVYHLYKWKELISKRMNHNSVYFIAKDSRENIVGVLPIIHMRSRLFGNFGVSLPYFNYGGALSDSDEIAESLLKEAESYFLKSSVDYIEYRDIKKRENLPVKTDKVTMILSLTDDADEMLKGFKAKLRSQIKRPIRENVVVEFGSKELLDDFYNVFTVNMRDLGTPPYSKMFFADILTEFSDYCYLVIARKDGEAVGAALLTGYNGILEIPWASTIRKYNSIGVNMLMYWEVIKKGIEDNYKYFDFGRCSKGSGTHKFKKQWGSEEKQLYWHYAFINCKELPQLNVNNKKYTYFIAVWKKLPVWLTRILGPGLVKNIS